MKILYITNVSSDSASGVGKKIYNQCKAFSDLGHECGLLFLHKGQEKFCKLSRDYGFDSFLKDSAIKRPKTFFRKVLSKAEEIITPIRGDLCREIGSFAPDIIYVRRIIQLFPPYLSFLGKIKGKSKIFYELPTYPYTQEYKIKFTEVRNSLSNILTLSFDFRSIERLRKVVDEFIVVSEIDDVKARERLGKYRIIPNGFDISSVPVKKIPKLENEIHILGLANLASWHGYDRIVAGIACYKGPYKIIFHLAGGSGISEVEKLKTQAARQGVSSNIVVYPPLYGDDLSALFDKCHVAAGSLGIHRLGLQKAAILKLREYCSRGIPFFASCLGDDFRDFKFYLNIEASEEPADLSKICNFVENICKTEDYPQIMRRYAEENLDWKVKMLKLLD